MIVKMTILRLLGSSDNKEKIGVGAINPEAEARVLRRLNRRCLKTSIGAVVQRLHFWGFLSLHTPVKPTVLFKSIGAIDQVAVGAVTASRLGKCTHRLKRR